jgi:hypothetical protein
MNVPLFLPLHFLLLDLKEVIFQSVVNIILPQRINLFGGIIVVRKCLQDHASIITTGGDRRIL